MRQFARDKRQAIRLLYDGTQNQEIRHGAEAPGLETRGRLQQRVDIGRDPRIGPKTGVAGAFDSPRRNAFGYAVLAAPAMQTVSSRHKG